MEGKELLAAINASLNALSTLLLIAAFVAVRKRKYALHGTLIVASLLSSAVFLACYLYSHYTYPPLTMGIPMGWFKAMYLIILLPHVLLAIAMLPFIGAAVFFAISRRWTWHVRVVRYAWPVWLYVSVTGVVVFALLRFFGSVG